MRARRYSFTAILCMFALIVLCYACGGVAENACHRLCSNIGDCFPNADLTECHETCRNAPAACADDRDLAQTLDECRQRACAGMLVCAWAVAASRPECVQPGSSLPRS